MSEGLIVSPKRALLPLTVVGKAGGSVEDD